ncbi:FecR family protein [Stakelama tenebrarum]|uniref:FecR family protein n=1 Tax=Stakelama tenebrarum TaxID=2711215 RepID=A0A6G6Y2C3_9SPHN|nr:FecR family protein [Sphingosinithalassobacter tenebrarum]QIG78991.1 FecR family protein [Sphingosinithalassobacter tenebrarum]
MADTYNKQAVIDQAARWAAMIDAGDMTEGERAECETWCAADPGHREVLERMLRFHDRVDQGGAVEKTALRKLLSQRANARRVGGATLLALCLAVAGWLLLRGQPADAPAIAYHTGRGEQRIVELDDGSRLTIDTDGSVDVTLTADRRRVHLHKGQVFAEVSKNPSRPFIVTTKNGSATALGTAFAVRQTGSASVVTVTQSRVRVCPGDAPQTDTRCLALSTGQRARMTSAAVTRLPDIDPELAMLWTKGWLEADDLEVSAVLLELGRYSAIPIRFEAGRLAGRRVTGSYPLTDIDRALEGLARTADLDVRKADSEIVITPR